MLIGMMSKPWHSAHVPSSHPTAPSEQPTPHVPVQEPPAIPRTPPRKEPPPTELPRHEPPPKPGVPVPGIVDPLPPGIPKGPAITR